MKQLVFLATMVMTILCKAQNEGLEPYSFTEVVKAEAKTANELYYLSKIWLADSYKNSKEVIQMDDPTNHTIVGKGVIRYKSKVFMGGAATTGIVKYTIKIIAKDGRYKYEFTDFIHEGNDSGSSFGYILKTENPPLKIGWEKWRIKVYKDIKEQIDNTIKPLENSLKNALNKEKKPNDDW